MNKRIFLFLFSFLSCFVTIAAQDTPLPYAVLSSDNTTLTFYYDNDKELRSGMDVGPFQKYDESSWYDNRSNITTVVFDDSFANYTELTSTAFWFCDLSNLTTITGIENLKTANVTDMESMFEECSGLTSLDLSNFNTANVTDMSYMFYNCQNVTSLDVSSFNTANVTDMSYMFYNCKRLKSLDVSQFNTANVTDMRKMFRSCWNVESLNVSNFNTANVTSMSCMFYECFRLTNLDLSKFNTANVTDMGNMFLRCSRLTSLDLSHFNTANVTNMTYMFFSCSGLNTIYCNDSWSCGSSSSMFSDCTSLQGAIAYDSGKTNVTYANPDTGYFTRKSVSLKGDANGDGLVDVNDITAIVNAIQGQASTTFDETAADVNGDGVVDINDLTGLVNIIQGN